MKQLCLFAACIAEKISHTYMSPDATIKRVLQLPSEKANLGAVYMVRKESEPHPAIQELQTIALARTWQQTVSLQTTSTYNRSVTTQKHILPNSLGLSTKEIGRICFDLSCFDVNHHQDFVGPTSSVFQFCLQQTYQQNEVPRVSECKEPTTTYHVSLLTSPLPHNLPAIATEFQFSHEHLNRKCSVVTECTFLRAIHGKGEVATLQMSWLKQFPTQLTPC